MQTENQIERLPLYQSTMDALESARLITRDGVEYSLAREICPILGYVEWENFGGVIQKGDRCAESERN